eukprot:ANDGO_03837.mRNA.1 hypothetical protein SAMD00019534_010850
MSHRHPVFQSEESESFLQTLLAVMKREHIQVEGLVCDHLCYRVSSESEYQQLKTELENGKDVYSAELLAETLINGRPIATYAFRNAPLAAVDFDGHTYAPWLLELPCPKPGSTYVSGFEHAEFVLAPKYTSIQQFLEAHPAAIQWDLAAMKKTINADARFVVNKNMSAKFHMQPLDKVIEFELAHPECVQ